jgi:sugar lactone lactonase YvrE
MKGGERTFYQAAALHGFKARVEILDPAWELTRTVFLRGCRAAHYNPRDGRLYVGTLGTDSDGLYAVNADSEITRIADGDKIAGVAVHPEEGHIFVAEPWGGKVYRTEFGAIGREPWVSAFKATDSDPNGMAFATRNYVGNLLTRNDGLVVDGGGGGPDEIYRFSTASPEQAVLLHSDGENEGPLVRPLDVTIGSAGIFIVDTQGDKPGCIFRLGDDGSLTTVTTQEPLVAPVAIATDPITGDLFVLDSGDKRVLRVDPETGATSQILAGLSSKKKRYSVCGLDIAPDGRQVFVTDIVSHVILTFTVRTAAERREAEQLIGPTSKSESDDAHPLDGTAEAANEKPNDKGAKTGDQGPNRVKHEEQDTVP